MRKGETGTTAIFYKTLEIETFIAGGYGMIGSNLATQLLARFPDSTLILGGRSPQKGEALAQQLGNAFTVSLNLMQGEIPPLAAKSQLIISAVPDPKHTLGEYAFRHSIDFIDITIGTADGYAPLLNMAMRAQAASAIAPLGYYEAGMFLPLVDKISRQFNTVKSLRLTALHDPLDPVGTITEQELGHDLPPAFIRADGVWGYTTEMDKISLLSGETVETTPFGILDISAIAAMTGAENVRLDVAVGTSEGMRKSGKASIELYVDVEGTDRSGMVISRRIVASNPQGQAYFTAFGIVRVIEALLQKTVSGMIFPEQLLNYDAVLTTMKDAGIVLTQP